MNQYLVLVMRRPSFDVAMVEPHMDFIAALRANGQLERSGGFSDSSGGAYILFADSMVSAQAIAGRDPLHASGSSDIRVYEWNAR